MSAESPTPSEAPKQAESKTCSRCGITIIQGESGQWFHIPHVSHDRDHEAQPVTKKGH